MSKSPNKPKKTPAKQRYKGAPEELNLRSFLASFAEEAEQIKEECLQERREIREAREHRDITPEPSKSTEFIKTAQVNLDIEEPVKKKDKAYRASLYKHPDTACLIFARTKDQAKYRGARYFFNNFHPDFTGKFNKFMMGMVRVNRRRELDKYVDMGRAPIPALLKEGFTLSCSRCHKHTFDYKAYEDKRCFVFEEGVNPIDYAEGFILCYDCCKELGY